MTLDEALKRLEALGNEKMRAQNIRHGSGDNQFGVRRGDVRKVAKEIKSDHELGLALWQTGNIDARFLAILILKPNSLSAEELDEMVRSVTFVEVMDWVCSYLLKKHPEKEALRQLWMQTDDPMALRAGWSLTASKVVKNPDDLELDKLLDRIESEMGNAASEAQWTMNMALGEIGIHHPAQRERALAVGEKLGMYRDYPVSKGCVSPFAPIWINEMMSRQG